MFLFSTISKEKPPNQSITNLLNFEKPPIVRDTKISGRTVYEETF